MDFSDINKAPHAINQAGRIAVIGEAGESHGFLWVWAGGQSITAFKGGTFESTSPTAGQIMVDGNPVAYLSTIGDTPEIVDTNEANGQFQYMRDQVTKDFHVEFIADQVKMITNELKAEK